MSSMLPSCMDMRGPSASSAKSLEETLCQCVEELKRKNLTISCAPEPASVLFAFENPNRKNEASPNLHHERGFKCNAPKASNEKMGPRQGAVSKQRQQRQTTKGNIKVYPADASNFRALVYEHTSKLPSSPPPDIAAQPSSPLTPHSIASTSSAWGFMSQPSSPTTPHSIQSTSTSPLSSPHHGHPNGGPYFNPISLPFKAHAEHSPHNTQLNVPYPRPSLCNANQNLIPNNNTNLHQTSYVYRSASTPCLGISSEAKNVPSTDGRPHGMSRAVYERALSLERYLLDDETGCNAKCM